MVNWENHTERLFAALNWQSVAQVGVAIYNGYSHLSDGLGVVCRRDFYHASHIVVLAWTLYSSDEPLYPVLDEFTHR